MINFQERICCFWSQNAGAKLNGKSSYETPVGVLPCGAAAFLQVGTHLVVMEDSALGPDFFTRAICSTSCCFLIPFSMCSPISFLGVCVFFFSFFFPPPATPNPSNLISEAVPGALWMCWWDFAYESIPTVRVTGTWLGHGPLGWGCCRCSPGAGQSQRRSSKGQEQGCVPNLLFHHQELLLLPSLA